MVRPTPRDASEDGNEKAVTKIMTLISALNPEGKRLFLEALGKTDLGAMPTKGVSDEVSTTVSDIVKNPEQLLKYILEGKKEYSAGHIRAKQSYGFPDSLGALMGTDTAALAGLSRRFPNLESRYFWDHFNEFFGPLSGLKSNNFSLMFERLDRYCSQNIHPSSFIIFIQEITTYPEKYSFQSGVSNREIAQFFLGLINARRVIIRERLEELAKMVTESDIVAFRKKYSGSSVNIFFGISQVCFPVEIQRLKEIKQTLSTHTNGFAGWNPENSNFVEGYFKSHSQCEESEKYGFPYNTSAFDWESIQS